MPKSCTQSGANMIDDDELEAELANLADLVDEQEMADELEHGKEVRLTIVKKKGETSRQAKARAALSSEYYAAGSIFQLAQILSSRDVEPTELAERLEHQAQQVKNGDLAQAESMLASQAYTLDALFHNLIRRAELNIGNEFSVVEKLFKLAMKAQSQSRTTWDSLASMKKPPPDTIKQTNIAHGHQQVNNFPEKENPPNELLSEKTDGERLDFGKAQEAVSVDSDVETVGAKHRPKNKRGEG
jgi:hypothetical protein